MQFRGVSNTEEFINYTTEIRSLYYIDTNITQITKVSERISNKETPEAEIVKHGKIILLLSYVFLY